MLFPDPPSAEESAPFEPPVRLDPAALLEGLTDDQRAAVAHVDGPLLVLAGPGSGKTRVIVHRIGYLIEQEGIAPWRILAVTFTNKAARQMKERLAETIGDQDAQHVNMGTFHSTCVRILRAEAEHARLDRGFVIYADDDQMNIMKRVLTDMGVDLKQFTPRSILSAIGMAMFLPSLYAVGSAPTQFTAMAGLVLFGLGWGFFDCNNMPILCQIARPELRATGYGIMNLVSISCGGFGDWGFGWLRDRNVPVNIIFGAFALVAALSIVIVLLIRPQTRDEHVGTQA